MKTLLLMLGLALASVSSYAQFTTAGNPTTTMDNVGIGTTSPAGKLHVHPGAYDLLTGAYTLDIGLGGTTYGWARAFRVVNTSNSNGQDGGAFGVVGYSSTPGYAYMSIPTSDPTGYNSTKILTLNNAGYVGVGTTNPISKLDVNGGIHTGGTTELGGGYLHVSTDQSFSSAANYTFRDGVGINNPNGTSFATGSSVMSVGAMSNGVSLITTGNVLIGQPSQTNVIYKLDVNGTARAKEIVVNTTGADFVFEPDYNLLNLTDVKKFIDKNHHLPGISSATEMQRNGMNVGELNTKLLQKIEELTLYLIEKDTQDKQKDVRLQSQQEQINQLKVQLTSLIKSNK